MILSKTASLPVAQPDLTGGFADALKKLKLANRYVNLMINIYSHASN